MCRIFLGQRPCGNAHLSYFEVRVVTVVVSKEHIISHAIQFSKVVLSITSINLCLVSLSLKTYVVKNALDEA